MVEQIQTTRGKFKTDGALVESIEGYSNDEKPPYKLLHKHHHNPSHKHHHNPSHKLPHKIPRKLPQNELPYELLHKLPPQLMHVLSCHIVATPRSRSASGSAWVFFLSSGSM